MRPWRNWLRRWPLAALAFAGAVSSHASTSNGSNWQPDEDTQYALDVRIRNLQLGDGVRGYPVPGGDGSCILLGDMLTVLDVPVSVDLAAGKASGWAFREANRLLIDRKAGRVTYGDKAESLAKDTIRDTPGGWCVDGQALGRWLGIDVKVSPYASIITLESKDKLPVELARERAMRAKHLLKKAALPLEGLPTVKLAYRMWRAPALDFVVNAGATYNAKTGMRVSRIASVRAAGEIARLSYDALLSGGQGRAFQSLRFRAYRSDPDGGLLGPLGATHVAIGDVAGPTSRLIAGGTGRGAEITNRPLFNPATFDRTRFEGDLPSGWEAELYRNGQLLAFAAPGGGQRYAFEDVQLNYGENRFEIVMYGPQGQQRTRAETINVGPTHVPPGQTHYYAGLNQPSRDLFGFVGDRSQLEIPTGETTRLLPKLQAAASLEHGVDKRTSVSALAAMMIAGDEKLTFVEGSVRRSIGPALIEGAVARQSGGGTALRGSVLGKIGSVNVSAEALALNNFFYRGEREDHLREGRLTASAPLKLGKQAFQLSGDVRYQDRDGIRETAARAVVSTGVGRINLSTGVGWDRQRRVGEKSVDRFDLSTIASGRIGDVRLRGGAQWEVSPEARLRTAELTAYWSASDKADWQIGGAYDADQGRARARLSHIRRFDALYAALSVEAASDKSLAVGLNLNFSLDGSRRGFHPVREPLAGAGQVRARVFRDDNNNGLLDTGEPLEKGAILTASTAVASDPSKSDGIAGVRGLAAYRAVAIGVDGTSLSDPMLTPRSALQVIVPRPGVSAEIDIALVGSGDVDGVLVKDDGSGFEGVDIELLDGAGKVIATARTDYDGFFLFERVPYGRYSFRVAQASADAARLSADLGGTIELTPDAPRVRAGVIRVTAAPRIASADR